MEPAMAPAPAQSRAVLPLARTNPNPFEGK